MSRLPRSFVLAAGLGLALPGAAAAAWAPGPEIVSVDNARAEQADSATAFAAISADGRYVVLQTKATNFFPDGDADPAGSLRQGGIFRYDRSTGLIALVADGDLVSDPGAMLQRRGAANPSVSADGSVVAFSTAQRLVPQDTNDNVDVYTRDMGVPLGADRSAGGAYQLVSALDGTDVPPNYEPRDPPLAGQNPGATLWPGAAISADGRFVAFRTVEQRSDLAGTGPLQTPAGTVFVRDRAEHRTTLVSHALSDGSPVGTSEAPIVISADGSTVAWVSNSAPQQTRFLDGEIADDQIPFYLWRRWGEAGARTRRITGAVDLDDPACPQGGSVQLSPTATGPCYGPLTDVDQGGSSIARTAPALSADGYQVAFLTGANPRPAATGISGLDLWTTSMAPGVSRKAGTAQLTTDTVAGAPRANGDIESVAMSAAGNRIAFTTVRSQFLVPTPAFSGAPRAENSVSELFAVDVPARTIERVAFAPGGGDANKAVIAGPTVSADGSRIAFVSSATNLLAGDANDVADAFVAGLRPLPPPPSPPAGRNKAPSSLIVDAAAEPELRLRSSRRKDGAVTLRVRSPLAGKLEATVSTRTRPKPPKGKAPKSSKKARRITRVTKTVTKAGETILTLKVPGADGRRVRAGYSLTAGLVVRLTPKQGVRLSAEDDITFRGTPAKKK